MKNQNKLAKRHLTLGLVQSTLSLTYNSRSGSGFVGRRLRLTSNGGLSTHAAKEYSRIGTR